MTVGISLSDATDIWFQEMRRPPSAEETAVGRGDQEQRRSGAEEIYLLCSPTPDTFRPPFPSEQPTTINQIIPTQRIPTQQLAI